MYEIWLNNFRDIELYVDLEISGLNLDICIMVNVVLCEWSLPLNGLL